jgi:hypothetical protein
VDGRIESDERRTPQEERPADARCQHEVK